MRNQIKAGAKVQALYWEDSLYYNAVVKEVTQDRTFLVYFPDYDDEETTVSIQQLKIQQDVKAKSDKHGKVCSGCTCVCICMHVCR